MKLHYTFYALIGILLLHIIPASLHAQSFKTITGQAVDKNSKDVLPGASVVIKGTTVGVSTDLQGFFQLTGVPANAKSIIISYLGYTDKEVALSSEVSQNLGEIGMVKGNSKSILKEVTIRASTEGQEKALNQQRSADNIKNVVSADLIGRFPDLNVAEALQRVSGVNIQRNRGEGAVISIRGTPPNFTSINVNGEQIPGTEREDGGANRNESLDMIPADQLASMEITKSLLPDQDGDAIGGSVNLVTPTAKGLESRFKVEVGGGYNDISGKLNGLGKINYNQRFFKSDKVKEGRLGILIGGSYFRNNSRLDKTQTTVGWYPTIPTNKNATRAKYGDTIAWIPGDFRLRNLTYIRTRIGVTSTIDYKFSNKSKIYFNYMYSSRNDDDQLRRLRADIQGRATIVTPDTLLKARIRRSMTTPTTEKYNHSFTLGGDHVLGKAVLDWAAFYTKSRRYYKVDRIEFVNTKIDLQALDNYTDYLHYDTKDPTKSINDPSIYSLSTFANDDIEDNKGNNLVGRFNVTIPFKMKENSGVFKFGAKHRVMNNDQTRSDKEYSFSGSSTGLFAQLMEDQQPQHYLNDRINFGPMVDANKFSTYYDANQSLFKYNQMAGEPVSYSETYSAKEKVSSVYAMSKLNFNKLMLLAGVRTEFNTISYNANRLRYFKIGSKDTFNVTPVSDVVKFTKVLPNLQLKYSINRNTILRTAATWSYGRPNFGDLVPRATVSIVSGEVTLGNAKLKPADAFNFDLLGEHYLSNVGIISGGFFYKHLNNFQYTSVSNIDSATLSSKYGLSGPNNLVYNVTEPLNGDQASIWGLELNTYFNMDFLPGLLKGFGLYANYTYAQSKSSTQTRKNVSFLGQANNTLNLSASYDYKGFTIRSSWNYNGDFLTRLASDADYDVTRVARWQWDMSAQQKLSKHLRIYTEFLNLRNTPQVDYQGKRERVNTIEYSGWWCRFGMSYAL